MVGGGLVRKNIIGKRVGQTEGHFRVSVKVIRRQDWRSVEVKVKVRLKAHNKAVQSRTEGDSERSSNFEKFGGYTGGQLKVV